MSDGFRTHVVRTLSGVPAASRATKPLPAPRVPGRPRTPDPAALPKEIGGPSGPEPTRYGDWERNGICYDF